MDTFRTVTLPLLRKALGEALLQPGAGDALELRVVSRGAAPGGGGEVVLKVGADGGPAGGFSGAIRV